MELQENDVLQEARDLTTITRRTGPGLDSAIAVVRGLSVSLVELGQPVAVIKNHRATVIPSHVPMKEAEATRSGLARWEPASSGRRLFPEDRNESSP